MLGLPTGLIVEPPSLTATRRGKAVLHPPVPPAYSGEIRARREGREN